jgi:hypothetical protein
MSKSPAINALRRKHAEVSGQILDAEKSVHAMRRDLAHIEATLRILDPTCQPRLIVRKRPRKPPNRIFARKVVLVRVTTMLREAEGVSMTIEAMVARIVADKGLDAAAEPMVRRVALIALRALQKRGLATGEGKPELWTLKP